MVFPVYRIVSPAMYTTPDDGSGVVLLTDSVVALLVAGAVSHVAR